MISWPSPPTHILRGVSLGTIACSVSIHYRLDTVSSGGLLHHTALGSCYCCYFSSSIVCVPARRCCGIGRLLWISSCRGCGRLLLSRKHLGASCFHIVPALLGGVSQYLTNVTESFLRVHTLSVTFLLAICAPQVPFVLIAAPLHCFEFSHRSMHVLL